MMVSLYPNIRQTTGGQEIDLAEVLSDIKTGRWAQSVALVRAALDDKARAAAKGALPYFTASGTFKHRSESGLLKHSGVMALDIDAKQNPDADFAAVRQAICADPHTLAVFTSAGGAGLCVLVKVSDQLAHHRSTFRSLQKHYREGLALTLDSLPDVSRPRYVSYDPDLYFNPQAETWSDIIDEPKPRTQNVVPASAYRASARGEGYGQAALQLCCDRIMQAPAGTRHNTLNRYAFLCGGYVGGGLLGDAEARAALQRVVDMYYAEAARPMHYRTIEDGLSAGRLKPVLPEPLEYAVRQQLHNGSPVHAVAIGISASQGMAFDHAAAMVQAVADEEHPELLTWWNVEEVKGARGSYKLNVSKSKFRNWLAEAGFRKVAAGDKYTYARIAGQVVTPVTVGEIKDFVRNFISALPMRFDNLWRDQLECAFLDMAGKLFGRDGGIIEFLDPLPADSFVRDTPTEARFFFADRWVAVTAKGLQSKDYAELPGLVWAEQVRPRAFDELYCDEVSGSDFARFCWLISAEDAARYDTLRRALGYFLHGHKDPANARAVVFCDEAIGKGGEPNGRTGKSLLLGAISQLIPVLMLDGKGYDERERFFFEGVTSATRVVFLDDVDGRKHRFDRFFNLISNDFTVRRMYLGQERIPFARAPKWAFALNDTFASAGESHEARKLEIEIAPRYSARFRPLDEFKRRFFDDWDAAEWNRFDAFLLDCARAYLAHGLPTSTNVNLARRKVMQVTGGNEAFAEFMAEQMRDTRLYLPDLRRIFIEQEGIADRDLSPQLFGRWVQTWASHGGVTLTEGRENFGGSSRRFVKIEPEKTS